MATIDDIPVPEDILCEFQKIIDNIPGSVLKMFITSRPYLLKGFRPGHLQPKVVRQRLKGMLKNSGSLGGDLTSLLSAESLNLQFIAVLSIQALQVLFTYCAAYFGRGFVAAALLDGRREVRDLARDYLDEPEETASDPQEAAAELCRELDPFLGHISKLTAGFTDVAAEMPQASAEELARCRKRLVHLEERQAEAKKAIRLEKRLNGKIRDKDREIASLRQKFSQEQNLRRQSSQKSVELQNELTALREGYEDEVARRVAREVSSEVRSWLKGPLEIEGYLAESGAEGDVLERAREALERQAKVDRHAGNIQELRRRLRDLQNCRAEVERAAAEALQPLPELAGLTAELSQEIGRIARLLEETSPENPLLVKLKGAISRTPSMDELSEVWDLVCRLKEAGAIDEEEKGLLDEVCEERQTQLYDLAVPETDQGRGRPGIMRLIGMEHPFHLILDGHNIMLDPQGLAFRLSEGGGAGTEERGRLLQLVDSMLAGSQCQASVFFDGRHATSRSYSSRVKEIFSGGGGAHIKNRADEAIVSYITALNQGAGEPMPIIVVSNDRELQGLARSRGARVMPLKLFVRLAEFCHV